MADVIAATSARERDRQAGFALFGSALARSFGSFHFSWAPCFGCSQPVMSVNVESNGKEHPGNGKDEVRKCYGSGSRVIRKLVTLVGMRLLISFALGVSLAAGADLPRFNDGGELAFPENYRDWVFLSSGLGMTYGPAAAMALENPMFDNVYATPAAFASFKETGKWPEGTMFALEVRFSTSHGSINKGGFYQTDIAAVEIAVKDTKRFSTG